jgi:hypothetical protein
VALVGVLVTCIVPVVVAGVLERRHPYFRTRQDVERALGLPVLARCPAKGK